jgi:hypothetical protein
MMDREKRRLARLEEEAARQGEPVGDGQTRPSYLEEKHALEKPDPEAWFDLMARHGWSREEAEEDLLWDAEVERRCRERLGGLDDNKYQIAFVESFRLPLSEVKDAFDRYPGPGYW